MIVGELNKVIGISTLSTSVSSGDVTETWGTAASVRAKVTQVDGSRYLKDQELVDRAVFKIICWDNSYSDNIKITYGTLTLYPIRPITRNYGEGSHLNEITILAATRK